MKHWRASRMTTSLPRWKIAKSFVWSNSLPVKPSSPKVMLRRLCIFVMKILRRWMEIEYDVLKSSIFLRYVGPQGYGEAAICFYKALKVYPAPAELVMVYQK